MPNRVSFSESFDPAKVEHLTEFSHFLQTGDWTSMFKTSFPSAQFTLGWRIVVVLKIVQHMIALILNQNQSPPTPTSPGSN